jgi:23S rRNA (guanosine2251-2'-O)-methyltransferase
MRRRRSEEQWVYGVNPVMEALRADDGRVEVVYLSSGRRKGMEPLMDEARRAGVPVETRHDPEFFDTRFPKGHQGVAARLQGPAGEAVTLDDLFDIADSKGETPFLLVLDQIEDPRNLGAMLRSAEAAGVHGVVMQSRRQASLGPVALKTSAGAAAYVPVCVVPNIKHALHLMKKRGVLVIGAEAGEHSAPWDVDLTGPTALVVGSEGKGLRRTVAEKCDTLVAIPMRGRVSSLNASVAAGVLLFELMRQKYK